MKTGGRKSGPGALPGKVCDLATSSAASEMSTPRTRHLGIFSAIVQAMQPEPVHRSRIRTGWAAFPKAERDADILEPVLMGDLETIAAEVGPSDDILHRFTFRKPLERFKKSGFILMRNRE